MVATATMVTVVVAIFTHDLTFGTRLSNFFSFVFALVQGYPRLTRSYRAPQLPNGDTNMNYLNLLLTRAFGLFCN